MAGSRRSKGSLLLVLLALGAALAAGARAGGPLVIATGQDGGWPDVRGFTALGFTASVAAPWGRYDLAFSAYDTYQSGVRVAVGDVTGDGRDEIVTAPGAGAWTEVRVFDGRTYAQRGAYLPYRNGVWWNGAFVATADLDGDRRDEILDGLDGGCCTTVHALDGTTGREIAGFFPFGSGEQAGAYVVGADLDGDGRAELLVERRHSTAIGVFGAGGGSPVRTIDPFAGTSVRDGGRVAVGDLAGDARPEVVEVAGTDSGVEARVVDPRSGTAVATYAVAPGALTDVTPQAAVADVDGDGRADLVVLVQTGQGTQVIALDRNGTRLGAFYVLEPGIVPGASLAAGDLEGDRRAEIVLGGGSTTAPWPPTANGADQRVAVYRLDGSRAGGFTAYPGLFQGGVRVAVADLSAAVPGPELLTAPGPGGPPEVGVYGTAWAEGRDRGTRLARFLAYEAGFRGGVSVTAGDVNGDGRAEIVVSPGPGRPPEVRVFDRAGTQLSSFLAFDAPYVGGVSVAAADVNGDGIADIVAGTLAAPGRVRAFSGGVPFGPVSVPLATGVDVGAADVNGDGRALVVAAAATGDGAVALLDPGTGSVLRRGSLAYGGDGVRLGASDLDHDGRDEILAAPGGWTGDGSVHVLDGRLHEQRFFPVYSWRTGLTVAAPVRLGLPLTAFPATVRYRRGVRRTAVVARFRDVGRTLPARPRARVRWGEGSGDAGVVVARGGGVYEVRAAKRYRDAGRFALTVTLTGRGRVSVARGVALVRPR